MHGTYTIIATRLTPSLPCDYHVPWLLAQLCSISMHSCANSAHEHRALSLTCDDCRFEFLATCAVTSTNMRMLRQHFDKSALQCSHDSPATNPESAIFNPYIVLKSTIQQHSLVVPLTSPTAASLREVLLKEPHLIIPLKFMPVWWQALTVHMLTAP